MAEAGTGTSLSAEALARAVNVVEENLRAELHLDAAVYVEPGLAEPPT